tara:strand:- start:780 stop:1136 length:357 start_codon:yes stop_codon:yes gene_type:complete
MTEAKEMWTIEELVELTEEVQNAEMEYSAKILNVQWCELTEAEEPKMAMPDESMTEEEKNSHYAQIAGNRVLAMIDKANNKNPDGAFINEASWGKLPTSLRWKISNMVMKTDDIKSDF